MISKVFLNNNCDTYKVSRTSHERLIFGSALLIVFYVRQVNEQRERNLCSVSPSSTNIANRILDLERFDFFFLTTRGGEALLVGREERVVLQVKVMQVTRSYSYVKRGYERAYWSRGNYPDMVNRVNAS